MKEIRNMIYHIYKTIRLIFSKLICVINHCITWLKFKGNNVSFSSFRTGVNPYVMVARGGKMSVGKNFAMNNGINHNPIGCSLPCTFFVDRSATLSIGDSTFVGTRSIILKGVTIGENSIVGAGRLVTNSIPDNQIWAGNPARFIRYV